MIDISKEAVATVHRLIQPHRYQPAHQCQTIHDMLHALQARVEELEYEQSADFDMGRVQGLDEAKAKVEELWAGRTCREVADAIEALKEQTND